MVPAMGQGANSLLGQIAGRIAEIPLIPGVFWVKLAVLPALLKADMHEPGGRNGYRRRNIVRTEPAAVAGWHRAIAWRR
jgi:hypothetical protein